MDFKHDPRWNCHEVHTDTNHAGTIIYFPEDFPTKWRLSLPAEAYDPPCLTVEQLEEIVAYMKTLKDLE